MAVPKEDVDRLSSPSKPDSALPIEIYKQNGFGIFIFLVHEPMTKRTKCVCGLWIFIIKSGSI